MKQHKPIGLVVQKTEKEIVNEFVDYVASFYSPLEEDCLYPYYKGKEPLDKKEIYSATAYYIGALVFAEKSFDGDSIDRERVRDILISVGYREVKN